ncbi:MAG: cytochrome c [Chthoniobacterales bacterium]
MKTKFRMLLGFRLAALWLIVALGGWLIATGVRAHDGTPGPSAAGPASTPAKTTYNRKESKFPDEAFDEAKSGITQNGTPVTPRTAECFPAEARDLFWKMDWVAGPNGQLQPLDFDENHDGKIDDKERDAIRGRNTWLLWGGGNETFWQWLQEKGYGLTDFLILMDSRRRSTRFDDAGLINQPGFVGNSDPAKRILGLYLDLADGDKVRLTPPPNEVDENGQPLKVVAAPPGHPTQLFKPGDAKLFEETRQALARDGLDPSVYGYPSGIFGLRLMLNPDFFGDTEAAGKARAYWNERVLKPTHSEYYTSTEVHADPKLVRPFRVAMSCGFCHVGPHPLNPPKDPNNPQWENLSSIIGSQYWDPQPAFGNLLRRENFLHHFLKSQAPGTIDTSLVSTDHINNTNVINAIFDVPARLTRALNKPTETQSRENLLLPSIEDPGNTSNQRHFPMVLFPGEDSVGIFAALARVPLNIGVFSEQWARSDNPVIGYTPQRPFPIEVGRENSVYWNVNEKYRVGYMAKFFTLGSKGTVIKSTAPMKLKDAGPKDEMGNDLGMGPDGKPQTLGKVALAADPPEKLQHGRAVFITNCAICHSSKQPVNFDLLFEREMAGGWDKAPAPSDPTLPVYTLPMEYGRPWEEFKKSPSYQDYVTRITALAGPAPGLNADDPFITDNFLSNELRVPVTLVGTESGRAMATNAMRGNVWDNYSSETFKHLKSVGKIRYYNPFKTGPDAKLDPIFGTNDEYDDGRTEGGPGYYRPASLISVWATAPYLHNNALGIYTHDPSVKGRLTAFDDGIRRLLWNSRRATVARNAAHEITYRPPGDLRVEGSASAANDPGYIYRLPISTYVTFQPGFIRPLIEGLLVGFFGLGVGHALFTVLTFWLWLILVLLFAILAIWGRPRHLGVLLLLLGVLVGAVLGFTGMGGAGGMMTGALMMGTANLLEYSTVWLWLIVVGLAFAGLWLLMTRRPAQGFTRALFILLALLTLFVGILANKFLNGHLKNVNPVLAVLPNNWLNAEYKGVKVGPFPRGTPVNLIMNMDPQKRDKMGPALVSLLRTMGKIKKQNLNDDDAYALLAREAGPALMAASKVPDFVLDRGHWFGETLTDDEKEALIVFLKTL